MAEESGISVRSAALPAITPEQMVMALDKYRELQTALDRSMPDQIMNLDGRPFRKKGYWRAIALAFNLEVKKTEERREVAGKFNDGRENFGYVVTYEARHPSGRSMTGDGACFAVEKARRFRCPHPDPKQPNNPRRTLHFPHNSCPDFDPEFQWKALPGEATEHNVRSHANTRAYNRAVSNLVGFGEVSAEEVERSEHQAADDDAGQAERSAGSGRSSGAHRSAAAAPDANDAPQGATKVVNVMKKSGESRRGPWTRFFVKFEDGREGVTFSGTDGEHAERAKASGALVIPKIEKSDKGFELKGFEPWPAKAEKKEEHPSPHHDEPISGPEKILTIREIKTDSGLRWAIQTSKRIVITDTEKHQSDAKAAREEGMGLTPRVEVVEGKNRLLGWIEVEVGEAEDVADEEPPQEEENKPRRRSAKK